VKAEKVEEVKDDQPRTTNHEPNHERNKKGQQLSLPPFVERY